jgi:peptide/nickel transport system permease protein
MAMTTAALPTDDWLEPTTAVRRGRTLPVPLFPTVVAVLVVLSAVFAPLIAPHDPNIVSLADAQKPPVFIAGGSWTHPLGTDTLGRDVLSRLIYGARTSLLAGAAAVLLAGSIGSTIAIVSGYRRGAIDMLLMRLTDSVLAIPFLLLALAVSAILGPGLRNVVLVLGLTAWAGYARIVRGEVLRLRESDFVALSQVAGGGSAWIMRKHIFWNVLNTIVILATLQFGIMIVAEASLSFLGLGVAPPTASWGGMLAAGRDYMDTAWWLAAFPGVAIMLTVLAANLAGDWLRVRLDPRLRQQ